ncbi:hypothetical protein A5792_25495 [Mycolicibacterium peregrinum]|uniref:SCP domain-containing protein n=1 Tax=Mycolicibacterium peregrinum TaxID=43304 RepID=A0A1A0R0M8_MYCPR|nr:hypothetical protein A5792_25495 [Mycolicibacterium peregrinum]
MAAPASADPNSSFTQAVVAARAASSCQPLKYDPNLERAAGIVNRSTESYFETTSAVIPADTAPQPLPILKDLGSPAGRATLLQGASKAGGMEVKGAIVQGYTIIPDCSYTDFGTSTLYSQSTGYTMVVAVLAGP